MSVRLVICAVLAALPAVASAQVFKCTRGKEVSYQSAPCEPGQSTGKEWPSVDYAPPSAADLQRSRETEQATRRRDAQLRGADLLHKNAVSTAKSSQRLPIDVKTLEHVQNMLIKTVNDFSRIQQEGEKDRAVVSKQLESMQERLKLQFTGSGNRAALAAATVEAQ